MSANIRVFDHSFFTVPGEAGDFTIAGLAPGPHEIVAWHERVGEVRLSTTVTAGRAATVSLSLPLTDDQ